MTDHTPIVTRERGGFIAPLLEGLRCALRADELAHVQAAALPPREAGLLDHEAHMTARLEQHFGEPVSVAVLQRRRDERTYAREILLSLPGGRVVQYAVVAIALGRCPVAVREEILAERQPLGRILQPLTAELRVAPVGFVRARLPAALAGRCGAPPGAVAWGRLVRIHRGPDCLIEGLELLMPP